MSNIDFQNGFICGMATRGLTKEGFDVKIVEAHNGYNGELSTWIVIELNLEFGAVVSAQNTEAFRVIGYKDWALKIYTVYEVVKVNAVTIAIRTDNFDEVDLLLEIHYMKQNGTLKTSAGVPIDDFAGIFYVQFSKPKIKIRVPLAFFNLENISNINASVQAQLLTDVVDSLSSDILWLDISQLGTVESSSFSIVLR